MPRSKEDTIRCYRCDKFIKVEGFWDVFMAGREKLLCDNCRKQFERWIEKGRFANPKEHGVANA